MGLSAVASGGNSSREECGIWVYRQSRLELSKEEWTQAAGAGTRGRLSRVSVEVDWDVEHVSGYSAAWRA